MIVCVFLTLSVASVVVFGLARNDRPTASSMHGSYLFDPSDKNKLAGFAHNVFVGRVIEKSGEAPLPLSKPGDFIPQSQFRVEVERNIKGSLTDIVTINQKGGFHPRANGVMLFDNDPILAPGSRYLFVTRYDKQNDWHGIVVARYGNRKIHDDAEESRLTKEFTAAVDKGSS